MFIYDLPGKMKNRKTNKQKRKYLQSHKIEQLFD